MCELHSILQKFRAGAMNRNRAHFVVLRENSYSVVVDTHPFPDGDGEHRALDMIVLPEQPFKYPIDSATTFKFGSRGISNRQGTICVPSNVSPDVDCIVVSWTRIHKGKLRRQDSPCDSENCKP